MTEILDKTKEWSDRFGSTLRASAQTQFAYLYKGAVGGIEHVISVDNGAYYMEMWRDGSETYYATTGAAIKPLPGLAKGARLDEALDRFFTLMSKVEKDKAAMKRRLHMKGARPAKKAIPKKVKRLLNLAGPGPYTDMPNASKPPGWKPPKIKRPAETSVPGGSVWAPSGQARKRVVAKVDPEIGPSHSVGHKKPSDLSPESGVSKLAKRMITRLLGKPYNQMQKQMTEEERFRRGGAPSKPIQPMHPGQRMGGGPEVNPNPTKKNVVALTAPGGVGNQPGSGRVKPGTPPKTYQSPQGFGGKRMGAPGTAGAPAGTSGSGIKARKIDGITGGRVGEGGQITPVKTPPRTAQGPGYGNLAVPRNKSHRKQAYMRKNGCECPPTEIDKALKAIQ